VPHLPDIPANTPDPDDESQLPTPVVRLPAAGKARTSRNLRDLSDDDSDDCLEIFNIPPIASRPPVRHAATTATKPPEQRKKRAATEPESSGPSTLPVKRPKLRKKTPGDKSKKGPPEDTDG
jgi:hypothetical protein